MFLCANIYSNLLTSAKVVASGKKATKNLNGCIRSSASDNFNLDCLVRAAMSNFERFE